MEGMGIIVHLEMEGGKEGLQSEEASEAREEEKDQGGALVEGKMALLVFLESSNHLSIRTEAFPNLAILLFSTHLVEGGIAGERADLVEGGISGERADLVGASLKGKLTCLHGTKGASLEGERAKAEAAFYPDSELHCP